MLPRVPPIWYGALSPITCLLPLPPLAILHSVVWYPRADGSVALFFHVIDNIDGTQRFAYSLVSGNDRVKVFLHGR